MTTRRRFLSTVLKAGTAAAFAEHGIERILEAGRAVAGRDPQEVATDEGFWREVQLAFTVDRNLLNLNNGGVSPSPRCVQEAMRRYLELSNAAPVYTMWRQLEPEVEVVRARLARLFGSDPEEVALTRNASESLETVIFGLDLKPGDEVLASNQNYPRMLNAWRQRARRQGIVLRTFSLPLHPTGPEDLVEAYRREITPRTRVLEVCHVVNWTGLIMPVREICRLGRERGVEVIVDGAHSIAHFPFLRDDLECDFFGASLHKWLFAPHGTGMLYVRRERIKDVWPLMAAEPKQDGDIRKFEEIGTHPAANHNAIAEALTFHEGLGAARKADRLRHLSRTWIRRLEGHPRVHLAPPDDPARSCGLRLLTIDGLDPEALGVHLVEKHKIITCPIKHDEFQGLRITPSVYTTLGELDRFVDVIEGVLKNGLPS